MQVPGSQYMRCSDPLAAPRAAVSEAPLRKASFRSGPSGRHCFRALSTLLWATCLSWLCTRPAAAAPIRPDGDTVRLGQPGGGELIVTLRARLAADLGPLPPTGLPSTKLYPFSSWRSDDDDLVSEVTAVPTRIQLTLRLHREDAGKYSLHLTAKPNAPTWIGLLALEAEVAGTRVVLGGRDLRPRTLDRTAALGGLDPKWVMLQPPGSAPPPRGRRKAARAGRAPREEAQPIAASPTAAAAGAWTFLLDDGADGLKVLRDTGGRVILQADLLSTEARPFSHFTDCTDNWRAPNQRVSLPARLVQPDEPLGAHLMLYAGSVTPLFKARYPEGRSAAFVITDHADQTAAQTLRALSGGTSDGDSSRWGKGGLLGAGIRITKALWLSSGEPAPPPLFSASASAVGHPHVVSAASAQNPAMSPSGHPPAPGPHFSRSLQSFRDRYGRPQVDSTGGGRPQLDDPEVVDLVGRLVQQGFEISPHSATPLRDERDRTEQALDFFSKFKARTWIDHQPYTNCEALINRGYRSGPFGIVDLLVKHGYSYAWSGIDVQPGTLNLLSPRRLDRYVPVLWPAGRLAEGTPPGPWLFSTMMTYIDSSKFFALYKKKSLDQLERERGLHIAHTYLEAFHPPTSMFVKRNLMAPGKHTGEVVPSKPLEQLFQALAQRVERGTLWIPTLAELGDHVRGMAQVTVRLESDGAATLRASQALTAATFVVPLPKLQVLADGQPLKGVRHAGGETSFWLDLPAGKPVRVTLVDAHGQSVRLLRTPPSAQSLLAARPGR